jgi:hypothetical protein
MGVGYDDLNTTDSDGDYGATARRATKRQRENELKESEIVEQGKRLGEISSETMQPLIAAIRGSSEREALPIVAANESNTDLEDRKQDLLVEQFDEVATRLEEIEKRRLADRPRPSDDYYKMKLESRMENLKKELDLM